jgi:hypothetical protein
VEPDEHDEQNDPIEDAERDEEADIGESPAVVAAFVMVETGRQLVSSVNLCWVSGFLGTGWMMCELGRTGGGELRRGEPRRVRCLLSDVEETGDVPTDEDGEGKRELWELEDDRELELEGAGERSLWSRMLRVIPRVGSLQVGLLGSCDSKYPSRIYCNAR